MISGSAACRIANSKKWYRSEWYTPGKKRKGSASMLMSVALHQSRISSSHAYRLPRWNVIFRSNWLIQFIMPEVKLAIRVFYLGLLQYLIYLELRFPEGKKKYKFLMYKVLDFISLLIFSALDQTQAFRHSRKVLYHWATPSVQEFELW